MGCDIHLYREKKVGGVWVSADKWVDEDGGGADVLYSEKFTDRNYELFGFLADGVRRDHKNAFTARGMPFNVSPEVKSVSDSWDSDGHNHSYLTLTELKEAWAFLGSEFVTISGMKDRKELEKLQESIDGDGETDWGLLYPYCQWTTEKTAAEFSVDVPAQLSLVGLERIIALFDGMSGADHRIVFWFDN